MAFWRAVVNPVVIVVDHQLQDAVTFESSRQPRKTIEGSAL